MHSLAHMKSELEAVPWPNSLRDVLTSAVAEANALIPRPNSPGDVFTWLSTCNRSIAYRVRQQVTPCTRAQVHAAIDACNAERAAARACGVDLPDEPYPDEVA